MSPFTIVLLAVVALGVLAYLVLPVRQRARAKSSVDLKSLVEQLEGADFFRYVSPEDRLSTKEKILQSDAFLFPEELGRSFFVDGEYLAEEGVLDFLGSVSPFLRKQGVHLPLKSEPGRTRVTRDPRTGERIEVRTVRWSLEQNARDVVQGGCGIRAAEHRPESGEYYKLELDGLVQEIWNENMTRGQASEAAMNHTFLLLNELLRRASSPERVYVVDNGNNYEAVFLTDEQFSIISNSTVPGRYKPWIPHSVE